ncbi:Uncharacterized hydrolase YxeP [Alloiococcus otitis]|uniref:Amidohydrolase n=1 Tax=Alloiococcus otitis ATCC 51267 TaxID=883081 RepID=K9ET33_9LACT|nr:M20 family metallopeptidase [Alloiococcus otitis]EKU94142.1 amidohydrolase [Alloiococcus otitis ATCC 51267]SUU81225.1 Uncharacterized hydrolase YxeP [Alloiococcus otitis]
MDQGQFVVETRRKLHQLAEESLEEHQTTQAIISYLEEWGIQYVRPLDTGVLAYMKGDSDSDSFIAFRSDIDALPIQEKQDHDFQSKTPGVMHACGHDGHMTALLLFAKRLSDRHQAGDLKANVIFIFQPAEESYGGGNLLLEAGAFDDFNVEKVYGVHLLPSLEEGRVIYKDGPITASATEYRIYLKGQSAHVAHKEEGHSAIEALSILLSQIPLINHYHLNGLNHNIIHIGQVRAGEAINTVAQDGYLEGTIRTYEASDLQVIKESLSKLVESVQSMTGVEADLTYNQGYPPTDNHPSLKAEVQQAIDQVGLIGVEADRPFLFGEDFSFYKRLAPSYFVFFGVQNLDKNFTAGLHTPEFNFDEMNLIKIADYYEKLLDLDIASKEEG